jgi:thiamine transport system ATP-binding protein
VAEIHLDGVTKRYGPTTALEDVSFSARDGEFFTLVGPSGCGKTTTLRTIAGFEAPDGGTIRFGDRNVAGLPPEDRNVGIVFQNYALFPHMTVAENVGYGLRFRDPPGETGRDERIGDLLDLVDLAGMEDRDPDQLSGGQRQRVALARALAPGPELLLLDEPMSALDARLRESLRRTVREIQQEFSITTVYVTHDQEEALAISDRVAVMHDGRLEQVGTPREVYRRPETEFVATFVGENNLFEGRVTDSRPDDGDGHGVSVDVGETTLTARTDGRDRGLEAGDRVTFCVRPETLSAGAEDNRLATTVESWEFLGESVRVRVGWRGRQLTVRLDDVPETNDLVVGFDPADARVIGRR